MQLKSPRSALMVCVFYALSSILGVNAQTADKSVLHRAEIPMISVVAPDWAGYTSPNGEGLYWDLLRAIYEPEGIKLKINTAPWNRALKMVTDYRNYMAIPGEYLDLDEEAKLIFPKYPLEREKLVVVTLKSKNLNVQSKKQLKGLHVAWHKGYDLMEPELAGIKASEFREATIGIKSLLAGDVDVLIEEPDEIEMALVALSKKPSLFSIVPYAESQYVYLGFNKGIISERLISTYNTRTEALVKSGELKLIYSKWGVDYPEIYQNMQ
jgi:polar amino acid transport system substrate-binding protein